MKVRYTCRHCATEIGHIPFESAKEIIEYLQKEESQETFIEKEQDGAMNIRCICEHCEQSLQQFPHYYAFKKWIQ